MRTETRCCLRLGFSTWAFWALGMFPVLASSCGSDPGQLEPDANAIAVQVMGLSSAAVKLIVTPTLDGKPATNTAQMEVTGKLNRFGLRLAKQLTGNLAVSVDAYDANQCRVGTGSVSTPIGPPWRYEITVTLTAPGPFCWSNPQPQGNTFLSLWAVSPNDVWAVGEAGTIHHFDGQKWNPSPSGTTETLHAVWASSATDVVAVGTKGTALRWDGSRWTTETSGSTQRLLGLWGSGTTAWAVGEAGTIFKRSGRTWTAQTSSVSSQLNGIWGRSETEVYAVGAGGVILKYNGSAWVAMSSGVATDLNGIWGDASTATVVGQSGTILALSGTTWTSQTSGSTETLSSVFSLSGGSYFAVGANGTVLRGNSGTWTPQAAGTTLSLFSVRGTAANDVWTAGAGGQLIRYNGTLFTPQRQGFENTIRGIAALAPNNIWAVGDGGYLARYDGSKWTKVNSGVSANLNAIWAVSANEIYATGDNGTFLRYNGTWSNALSIPSNIGIHGRGIWATDPSNIWIAATSSVATEIKLIIQDGIQWRSAAIPDPGGLGRVTVPNGLWGLRQAPNNLLFVVGKDFIIKSVETAGAHTVSMVVPGVEMSGVWGTAANDVWAVAQNGKVFRYDGALWGSISHGLPAMPLYGVYRFSPTSTVWIVGEGGTLWKSENSVWTTVESTTRNRLHTIRGLGASDLWVGGVFGTVLRSIPQ